MSHVLIFLFFFQAEDGIRDYKVTGVQTCALPISARRRTPSRPPSRCSSSIWTGPGGSWSAVWPQERVVRCTSSGRSEERRVGKEGRSRWARYECREKRRGHGRNEGRERGGSGETR